MDLRHLTVKQYRNLEEAHLPLDARFTVLWGHNGAGKTNILEAIYLVSTYRSFRTSDQSTLIRRGASESLVSLRALDDLSGIDSNYEVRIKKHTNSTRKSAFIDGKSIRAARDFYGRLKAILFTPEDLSILRGSPSGRRQFLDRVLFAQDRAHITDVQDYEKTLRARNKVLKSEGYVDPAQRDLMLDSYDRGLSDIGGRIGYRRRRLVRDIRDGFLHAVEEIHGPGLGPGLRYASRLEVDEDEEDVAAVQGALGAALHRKRGDDLARRVTTVGPHRDDLEFTVHDTPASEFASQGQARALVLAFKIAELRLTREQRGVAPVLLLDDVSSELDPSRNGRLFELLSADVGQCILTTTAAEFIRLGPGQDRRDIEVSSGVVATP